LKIDPVSRIMRNAMVDGLTSLVDI
jgi:hypothetical protein